jgi:hypothetical protein
MLLTYLNFPKMNPAIAATIANGADIINQYRMLLRL